VPVARNLGDSADGINVQIDQVLQILRNKPPSELGSPDPSKSGLASTF